MIKPNETTKTSSKANVRIGILAGFKLHIEEQKLWKYKGPRIAKTIFKKKRKMVRIGPPNFKTY